MDHDKFQSLVKSLYSIVDDLEGMFPGRHFTPDGHMVGSLGECLVADAYNLELMGASNEGYDAISTDGKKIEIKATQAIAVAFRSKPDYAIVIKIHKDGSFEECFNGPGAVIWQHFEGKNMPKNGQHIISLSRLTELASRIPMNDRTYRHNYPAQPNLDEFLDGIRARGHSSPGGKYWDELRKLLVRLGGVDESDKLMNPLILGGAIASSEEKFQRLRHHLEWALRHNCSAEAVNHLNRLTSDNWNRW